MYALDLICSNGHKFESWFRNRKSFEEQHAEGMIACPHCSDTHVKQQISPIRIGIHPDKKVEQPVNVQAKPDTPKLMEIIEKNFEDVGHKFPEEALKIHLGETEKKCIRGTATLEEEKELRKEGVPFFRIPNIQ